MRSRWDRKEGSLDLLLNTLCDVFGSFIMIALILVLPTGISHISAPVAGEEILSRRILTAEAEIEKLDQKIASSGVDDEFNRLKTEKSKIESTIKTLKEQSRVMGEQRAKQLSASIRDVTKEDAVLLDKIKKAQLDQEAAKNALDELNKFQANLTSRIDAINCKVLDAKKARTQEMRLPRERPTSKDATNVIFRYGRIHPLLSEPASGIRNRDSLEWNQKGDDAMLVKPIEGKGILPADKSRIANWSESVPNDCFVACYVYADSIEAFRDFRKVIQDKNMEIGWEPVSEGRGLIFSSHGSSPNPQ